MYHFKLYISSIIPSNEIINANKPIKRKSSPALQNTALNGSMERAFLSWLWENKIREDVSAEHTILYFLQRGRTTEAVEAYARIVDLEKRGGAIAWGKAKKETIEMLEERVKDLPVVVPVATVLTAAALTSSL